ncbi:peptide chain release factor 2 [Holotrichia oblita]|nr:peptide chain release factor 2 [Holotrichia oblita]
MPFIYRIHETPTQEKILTLKEFAGIFGVTLEQKGEEIKPKEIQALLNAAAGTPYSEVLSKVALRSMMKAKYLEDNLGHFGLAAKYYCHFTSPIRRYPDLMIHRIIKDYLHNGTSNAAKYLKTVEAAALQSSEREKLADDAERDVDDLKKAEYMADHIGEEYEGIISGVIQSGIFVELENTCEGLIRVENLPESGLEHFERSFTLSNGTVSYRLGDKLKVRIAGVDMERRKADFELLARLQENKTVVNVKSGKGSSTKIKNNMTKNGEGILDGKVKDGNKMNADKSKAFSKAGLDSRKTENKSKNNADTYEAGIALTGAEVKSIRAGKISLGDSFCSITGGEIFVRNMQITPYDKGSYFNSEAKRDRKLLMHSGEIARLKGQFVKLQIALCQGKKLYDKRESIKEKDDNLKKQIEDIKKEQEAEGFYDDFKNAAAKAKQLKGLEKKYGGYIDFCNKIEDLQELAEMAEESGDEETAAIVAADFDVLKTSLEAFYLETLLKGDYDGNNCLMTLHAGAGGTEAQDWTQMLYRMYFRYAERNGFSLKVLDSLPGDEAGLKSISFELDGENAYGYMKAEKGVHRLVRISPFDSNARRHTSFAALEVAPILDESEEIEIRPEDLKIDTYRSGGAGGQHVNKTESAIRLTHIPTGFIVQCQNERSQIQNREIAMKMLMAKLIEKREQEQQEKYGNIKGELKKIEWGSQIRSYVFAPYTMVKDHRTNYEKSDVAAVMDGDIRGFIEDYLRKKSSCDETAASVVKDGRIMLSNVINSQIDIHKRYGGVVPEIASRNHTMAIIPCIDEALRAAKVTIDEIGLIAVTQGAGLIGALLVGVSAAKALSYAKNIPLMPVEHTKAHIAANYIAHPDLEPPFLCLVASGGHTSLIRVDSYISSVLIGSTLDDAVGEAFDKVGRKLGLDYPAGAKIDALIIAD